MNSQDITLKCMNGFTIYVKGSNLIVATKRKEETYPISKIQSFAMKEAHGISPGTIAFRTAQAASGGIGLGFGISAALGAEQSFFFAKSETDTAIAVRDRVVNFGAAQERDLAHPDEVVSVVEEIRGLKALLDEGILTEEEFAAKKKQLLGI